MGVAMTALNTQSQTADLASGLGVELTAPRCYEMLHGASNLGSGY